MASTPHKNSYLFTLGNGIDLEFKAKDLENALRQFRKKYHVAGEPDGLLDTHPWKVFENGTLLQERK